MKAVYIRIRSDSGLERTASCSKRLIEALLDRQLLSSAEAWRFEDVSDARPSGMRPASRLPVHSFPADTSRLRDGVTSHVRKHGSPDILWVEGTDHPAHLAALFDLFPRSFKVVYSKHWEPWIVEHLDRYDLCLIDDPDQAAQVHLRWPTVRCGVWDKLIDYAHTHRPLAREKTNDVCYVAYLRPRKNHELLFRSLAALGRRLRCVAIGDDRRGNRVVLERLAAELRLDVEFTGGLDATAVNALVNRSRIGVMCSRRDAAPRAILEYMAADVPVLVNAELLAGARYVGPQAGLIRTPDQFASGIAEILDNPERFSPRTHFLANYSADQIVDRFVGLVSQAGLNLSRTAPTPHASTQGKATPVTHTNQPAPLVIGCMGGSGSRMLRDILAASPEIHMDAACGPNSKDSLGSKVFLDRDDRGSPEYLALIHQFMNQVANQVPPEARRQYKWFGWKNPRNIHIVDLLLEIHPRLRFLHLVRNPAALVNGSQGRKTFKRERSRGGPEASAGRATFVLNRWARVNLPVWRRHRADPRYRLVHYEDFLRDLIENTRRLCEWLDVAAPDCKSILAAVAPPSDALARGRDVDITLIADAAAELGYTATPRHVDVHRPVATFGRGEP